MVRPDQNDFVDDQAGYEAAMQKWNAYQAEQAEQADTSNAKPFIIGGAVLALLLLAFFAYKWNSSNNAAAAAAAEKQEIQDKLDEERSKKQAPAPVLTAPVWESEDEDGDGLPNGFEEKIGTDPYAADWDGDDISDGDEVGVISDLSDKNRDGFLDLPDADGDGTPDVFESNTADADGDLSPDWKDPCEDDFHNRCAEVKVCCNGTKTIKYRSRKNHLQSSRSNGGSYAATCQCGSCTITIQCDGRSTCGRCSYKERRSRENYPPPPPPAPPVADNKPDNSPCNAGLIKNGPPPKGFVSWCAYWDQHYPDKIKWIGADKFDCVDICGHKHRDAGDGDGAQASVTRMVSNNIDDDY